MKHIEIARQLRDLDCQELAGGKGSHRKWYKPAKNWEFHAITSARSNNSAFTANHV
jgi:hypothetical protein